MGLTIHYKLKHTGDETGARRVIEQLHQAAQDLPFKTLQPIIDVKGEECRFEDREREDPLRWLLIQARGSLKPDEHTWLDVMPTRVIAFDTWPGEGCEPANFGLCQYPESIKHQGRTLPTKMPGWRWQSFCKTQYASDPQCGGIANFLRCHLLVVALLDKAMELGCLAEVHDEGQFWEKRDLKALIPEIESWNGMIAAFAGQLKDAVGDGVEAPITEYRNFEQLELTGQGSVPPQLIELIRQVIQKP